MDASRWRAVSAASIFSRSFAFSSSTALDANLAASRVASASSLAATRSASHSTRIASTFADASARAVFARAAWSIARRAASFDSGEIDGVAFALGAALGGGGG